MKKIVQTVYQCGICRKKYEQKFRTAKCEKDCKKKAELEPKLRYITAELKKLLKLVDKINNNDIINNIVDLIEDTGIGFCNIKQIKSKLNNSFKDISEAMEINVIDLTYLGLLKEQLTKLKDAI